MAEENWEEQGDWGGEAEEGDWGEQEGFGDYAGGEQAELGPFDQIQNAYTDAEYAGSDEEKLTAYQGVIALSYLAEEIKGNSEKADAYTLLFKSHQGMVVIYFAWPEYNLAAASYEALLDLVPQVTINDASKGIEQVLAAASTADFDTFDYTYQMTRDKLASQPQYQAMIHKFNMKQCNDLFASNEVDRTLAALEKVHDKCRTADWQDDQKSYPSELIQIYALRIKLGIAAGTINLKELYLATKDLQAPVKEPQSQSVLEECWGRFLASEGDWTTAYTHFDHAFMNYQTSRENEKAKQCLQYLILANILLGGKLNPFNSPESKALKSDPAVRVFDDLRKAFDKNDVTQFSKCVATLNEMNDEFVLTHIKSMIWDFHSKSILNIVKSYRKIKLEHLAQNLQIDVRRCQQLVVSLILDGKLFGKIDQVKNLLDLSGGVSSGNSGGSYKAMDAWTKQLGRTEMSQPTRGGGMGVGGRGRRGMGFMGGMMGGDW